MIQTVFQLFQFVFDYLCYNFLILASESELAAKAFFALASFGLKNIETFEKGKVNFHFGFLLIF